MTEKSEIDDLRKKLDNIEESLKKNVDDNVLKQAEDFSFKPDKQKHLFVGLIMGFVFSYLGMTGLLIGWLIVVGWELFQGWSNTGHMEFADIVYGGIPLTIAWVIGYLAFRKRH